MASSQDYWKWYENLKVNSDHVEANQKLLFQIARSLNLNKAKTLMSIGAGTGLLDDYLVSKCMTDIEHYIGVESHEASCDELHKTMGKYTKMKASIVNKNFVEWEGPDLTVDVILASHVLYPCHVPDPMAAIRRLCGWLKPGGPLIIVLGCENSAYGKIAEEVFGIRSFGLESVQELMKKEGFLFSDYGRSYTKYYTDCDNEEMVKLNFQHFVHGLVDTQMTEVVRIFKERHKGSRCEILLTNGYLIVAKPEI